MTKYALALLVSLAFTPAAMAATKGLDASFTAMSKSGTHQFYVWCTGRRDSEQTARGNNAKEAQDALARKVGGRCWPVWQGLR